MRRSTLLSALVVLAALCLAPSAQAAFGLGGFDVAFTAADGSPAMQAGSHPFAMTTSFTVASRQEAGIQVLEGALRDLEILEPAGFVGDTTALPRCSAADFLDYSGGGAGCADSTAVGTLEATLLNNGLVDTGRTPLYNLVPDPHEAAKLGAIVEEVPVTIDLGLNPDPPYNIRVDVANTPQILEFIGAKTTVWGVPADPAHDHLRGECGRLLSQKQSCPSDAPLRPFLTLPRSCAGPLTTTYRADSWWSGEDPLDPGPSESVAGSVTTHDGSLPPQPLGTFGCAALGFHPTTTAKPTSVAASSPTGLDFSLDVEDEGLASPEGIADADLQKAVVTLPQGFSVNPSIAEGLAICSEAQLAKESPFSAPGEGCPDASKIGTVEVESPLLEESVDGAIYQAAPYQNPFNSLIVLYMVIKNPTLGIIVRQPLKVQTDPATGQITTVAEELPELPFSHFRLHFREGTRSPLATPPACGTHTVKALLYPSSGNPPIETSAAFEIISGPDSSPCPTGGLPPFHPNLEAGTINNAAGHYSPFYTRLSRNDSEQEITHFSIKLPPGLIGKLAGIPYCSDAAIAQATARTGPHGGQEELNSPSCPAASEVGHSLAGAGVGPSLAYAPGKLYLAGPYHGSQLSFVSITAAKVGPFDLGTVVVRFALKINPETAEVFVDATGSDPLPHIIQGIPVHLRDIRAYVDRPEFVLNPTNCERTSTASTVLGSGLDFASEADDQPITVTSPFQAADCASLGFAPKLALNLKGATKRGGTPALKATLTYPKGSYANIKSAQVTLPHSEFLEQAHIKTICTRVQFAAGGGNGEQCPAASIYGHAKAVTPILSEPLEGPVYLRSSSHNLPDLVAALHNSQVDFDLVGRIDSVKGGRIRNTFEAAPDVPVTSFTLELQGAKKGLLVNSTNLCKSTNRAIADFTGQNGKVHDFNPVVQPRCGKAKKKHKAKSKSKRLALTSPW